MGFISCCCFFLCQSLESLFERNAREKRIHTIPHQRGQHLQKKMCVTVLKPALYLTTCPASWLPGLPAWNWTLSCWKGIRGNAGCDFMPRDLMESEHYALSFLISFPTFQISCAEQINLKALLPQSLPSSTGGIGGKSQEKKRELGRNPKCSRSSGEHCVLVERWERGEKEREDAHAVAASSLTPLSVLCREAKARRVNRGTC